MISNYLQSATTELWQRSYEIIWGPKNIPMIKAKARLWRIALTWNKIHVVLFCHPICNVIHISIRLFLDFRNFKKKLIKKKFLI